MADIFGVRVTPELDTLNSLIICNKPGGQTEPAIVFNGENFIVVWVDAIFSGIAVARVTPQGVVLDTGIYIGGGSGYGEDLPDISCDSQRSFVVWSQEFYGVCGRFINSSVQPEDSVITIDTTLATSSAPKVEFDNNNYLVVWGEYHDDYDIYGNVDITIGVKEEDYPLIEGFFPSIISGNLLMPGESKFIIYDITGRRVKYNNPGPGVYFIKNENRIVKKVVKVR